MTDSLFSVSLCAIRSTAILCPPHYNFVVVTVLYSFIRLFLTSYILNCLNASSQHTYIQDPRVVIGQWGISCLSAVQSKSSLLKLGRQTDASRNPGGSSVLLGHLLLNVEQELIIRECRFSAILHQMLEKTPLDRFIILDDIKSRMEASRLQEPRNERSSPL